MQISFKTFEQQIDETILKRGYGYYKKGLVTDWARTGNGKIIAHVEGTELYTVTLLMSGDIIRESVCSCPYDMGPVCKHIVAVLLAIVNKDEDLPSPKKRLNRAATAPKSKKRKTEKTGDVINSATFEQLTEFIKRYAAIDSNFDKELRTFLSKPKEEATADFYRKQMKEMFRKLKRNGFIEWNRTQAAGDLGIKLLKEAEKLYQSGNTAMAIKLCFSILEEFTKALQFADDSNGEIGSPITRSLELLSDIASGDLHDAVRIEFLDHCLKAFHKNLFSGWDWHLGMLILATTLSRTPQEIQQLRAVLKDYHTDEFDISLIRMLELRLIQKNGSDTEVKAYIQKNLKIPEIRDLAIKNAFEANDFKQAKALALEGFEANKKTMPGLMKKWVKWLLTIAQKTNQPEAIIQNAKWLLIDEFPESKEYYLDILKTTVPKKDWNNFVMGMIKDYIKLNKWDYLDFAAYLYIEESWWSQLFDLIRTNPDLDTIDQYGQYLYPNYANEIHHLYAEAIKEFIKGNLGRSNYQKTCQYLRRLKKAGGIEMVNVLITQFMKEYAHRPALIEELSRI